MILGGDILTNLNNKCSVPVGKFLIEVLRETRKVFRKADTSTPYSLCLRIDRKKERELMAP